MHANATISPACYVKIDKHIFQLLDYQQAQFIRGWDMLPVVFDAKATFLFSQSLLRWTNLANIAAI